VALQLGIQDAVDQSRDKISPDQVFALARATAHCGELIREVRQICHGLYPPTLESLGLCSALAQLANHCESAGLTVETECTPALHTLRLLPDHEIALFRIAQEAVNNVIRHSQATEVMLSMAIAGDEVVLKVIDNGVGFDTHAKGRWGLGLNTMRDRAEAVGGQLDLASEPGRTEVAAAIPLMLRDDET
jgi:two-component system NarL family sensor kinase